MNNADHDPMNDINPYQFAMLVVTLHKSLCKTNMPLAVRRTMDTYRKIVAEMKRQASIEAGV